MFRNLIAGVRGWLVEPQDARRAPRTGEPSILAYYWDGSVPEGRSVRDISAAGAHIVADEHWYPGTIVRLVLRGYRPPPASETAPVPSQTVSVSARVVRQDADGFAVEFMFPTPKERTAFEKFILGLLDQSGAAVVLPASSNSQ